ncbi:hypothetical protein JW906_03965 [bacterium]|nr:hypothetical protein [bacterium]
MKSDPNNPESFTAKVRAERTKNLNGLLVRAGRSRLSVLDIGGTWDYWERNLQYFDADRLASVEIVNLPPFEERRRIIRGIPFLASTGDALDLKKTVNRRYDLVLSNSVIEHVGNLRDQKIMADQVRELGSYWFVQTPSPFFPVEPHFYVPFFSWFPLALRAFLHRHVSLGFMGRQRDWLNSRIECENIRLLKYGEFKHLFPHSDIIRERFFGFTVSYIATNLKTDNIP